MELLIKRVGVDNVFFATEMFGATNAIDLQTGGHFEETVPLLETIKWLTDEDRHKITEGNVRKVYNGMAA
jgi:4-oxalmesaconate hydratase